MVDTASVAPQAPPTRPRSTTPPLQRPPRTTAPRATVPEQPHPTATLIGSVQRAMRLLESVAEHHGGAPAKQLARETGLALPTAYHLLRTLVHEGYLRRDRGLFFLGEAAERLAGSGAAQKRRSTVADTLAQWRDSIGAPVYYARYREGEVEVMYVADTPGNPAVEEWADFRETGHAHAIGQCLLSQVDEPARREHLARYPVQSITPYTVRDDTSLLRRLERTRRMEPVVERQEYALGTVCAAIPITVGTTAATLAISLPARHADRLLPAARQLQSEIARKLGSIAISISI
ncbi:IclR family transcriptional regulator [Streptomyces sp. Amel2xC10]|uniref:IclR family transcriptional regulator n=1 Tax=Streptomyces sp. Amel2xC10 TaxID=1305826 RepID=UPI000A087978|nr:helix-turn-helix domain-containing protein [Streptomyces sp. Amel2xC10]SMF63893.1 transcriptional regulator, IclR family [Streptomyces sp. Amel2xC10]